jgi:hypothetical protein
MGCDIHIVLERKRKRDTDWTGIWTDHCGPESYKALVARRNYGVFAELAHVRGRSETGAYPHNLPEDVSRLAWQEYMRAPTDHHSPSHMTLQEFTERWLRVMGEDSGVRPEFATWDLFGVSGDEEDAEFRVVFWFDN